MVGLHDAVLGGGTYLTSTSRKYVLKDLNAALTNVFLRLVEREKQQKIFLSSELNLQTRVSGKLK